MAQLELLECFRNDPQLREKVERLNGAEERLEAETREKFMRLAAASVGSGAGRKPAKKEGEAGRRKAPVMSVAELNQLISEVTINRTKGQKQVSGLPQLIEELPLPSIPFIAGPDDDEAASSVATPGINAQAALQRAVNEVGEVLFSSVRAKRAWGSWAMASANVRCLNLLFWWVVCAVFKPQHADSPKVQEQVLRLLAGQYAKAIVSKEGLARDQYQRAWIKAMADAVVFLIATSFPTVGPMVSDPGFGASMHKQLMLWCTGIARGSAGPAAAHRQEPSAAPLSPSAGDSPTGVGLAQRRGGMAGAGLLDRSPRATQESVTAGPTGRLGSFAAPRPVTQLVPAMAATLVGGSPPPSAKPSPGPSPRATLSPRSSVSPRGTQHDLPAGAGGGAPLHHHGHHHTSPPAAAAAAAALSAGRGLVDDTVTSPFLQQVFHDCSASRTRPATSLGRTNNASPLRTATRSKSARGPVAAGGAVVGAAGGSGSGGGAEKGLYARYAAPVNSCAEDAQRKYIALKKRNSHELRQLQRSIQEDHARNVSYCATAPPQALVSMSSTVAGIGRGELLAAADVKPWTKFPGTVVEMPKSLERMDKKLKELRDSARKRDSTDLELWMRKSLAAATVRAQEQEYQQQHRHAVHKALMERSVAGGGGEDGGASPRRAVPQSAPATPRSTISSGGAAMASADDHAISRARLLRPSTARVAGSQTSRSMLLRSDPKFRTSRQD